LLGRISGLNRMGEGVASPALDGANHWVPAPDAAPVGSPPMNLKVGRPAVARCGPSGTTRRRRLAFAAHRGLTLPTFVSSKLKGSLACRGVLSRGRGSG
jgi:hypothetical protein